MGGVFCPRETELFTSRMKAERERLLPQGGGSGIEKQGKEHAGIRQKKLPEGLKE